MKTLPLFLLVLTFAPIASAQSTFSDGESKPRNYTLDSTDNTKVKAETAIASEKINSLNDVRDLGEWTMDSITLSVKQPKPPRPPKISAFLPPTQFDANVAFVTSGTLTATDPRTVAKQQLDKIRNELSENPSSEERAKLKTALMDYFVADMRIRVRELDEIKEKTKQMEQQLERRLDAKEKVVELQLELLINQAAGLGFYSPNSDDKKQRRSASIIRNVAPPN